MEWLNKWFGETEGRREPRSDVFRDAASDLTLEGKNMGWLTTAVGVIRSFPLFRDKQEQM